MSGGARVSGIHNNNTREAIGLRLGFGVMIDVTQGARIMVLVEGVSILGVGYSLLKILDIF